MPGSASSQDVLQQTVDGFAQQVQKFADGIAGRLGQPMSGTQLSKDDAVQRWNFTPLGSTQAADQAYHQLVAQGTPPGKALDQVYPMRSMLFQGGTDVNESIATARQIAGWAADASGSQLPQEPQHSTLPLVMAMQPPQGQQAPPPMQPPGMAGPGPGPAAPGAIGVPPAPMAGPPPGPVPMMGPPQPMPVGAGV